MPVRSTDVGLRKEARRHGIIKTHTQRRKVVGGRGKKCLMDRMSKSQWAEKTQL